MCQRRGKSVREEKVTITSAGLELAGVIRVPAGLRPGRRRRALLGRRGFGSNKNSQNVLAPCKVLEALGYVTLRFDVCGRGESEGEHGRVICLEQVEDTRNALTFLSRHPAVAADRIAVVGTSVRGAG